jgi:tetratricopeptide (TPR) repeat protein
MGSTKYYSLIIIGVIFSVALCAALFFSYSAYVSSNRIEKNFKLSLGELEQEVNGLRTQLAAVKNRTEDNAPQRYDGTAKYVTEKSKKDTVVGEPSAIRRLENIVESTGLDQLAENQNMDPKILAEIYDEYTDRKQVVQRHEQQLEKNRAYHNSDSAQYGEELMALYERARLRRGAGGDRQESDSAFAELLANYPEAYATGMAIAERALVSGFRRNTSEVEKYYDMLRENENFSHIVTDRGVEAMPNVEYFLARQYIRQGNSEDAMALIESLEKNYPDSLLFTRRMGSGPRWQPVSQVVANLRREVK